MGRGHRRATTLLDLHFPGLGLLEGRRGRLANPKLMALTLTPSGVKPPSPLPTNYLELFQSPEPEKGFLEGFGLDGESLSCRKGL